MSNAVVLTTSDCNKGFWHQLLDEETSFLTTFNTEFGQFRFTVMQFGLSSAGDVFERKLDSIFGKLPNINVIADDVMTYCERLTTMIMTLHLQTYLKQLARMV